MLTWRRPTRFSLAGGGWESGDGALRRFDEILEPCLFGTSAPMALMAF